MAKGYKMPKSSAPRATMRAGKAKGSDLLSPASKLSPKIPELRPTWKRNHKSAPGFKPGSY